MSLPLPSVLQCFCMFVTVLLQNGCSGLLLFQNGLLCVFLNLNVYHPKKKSTFGLSFKNILKTIVQHVKSRKQQRSTPDRIEGRSGARYICQFGYYNSFQFGIYSRLYPRDAWNAKGWRAIAHSFGTRTCQAFAACTRREYWEI